MNVLQRVVLVTGAVLYLWFSVWVPWVSDKFGSDKPHYGFVWKPSGNVFFNYEKEGWSIDFKRADLVRSGILWSTVFLLAASHGTLTTPRRE